MILNRFWRPDRFRGILAGFLLACALVMIPPRPARAAAPALTLTISAPNHAYHNALVSVVLPARVKLPAKSDYMALQAEKTAPLFGQILHEGDKTRLTFLLPDLAKGETRVYHLRANTPHSVMTSPGVNVKSNGDDLEITIGSTLFTRYTTKSGPNKPFFYPILTPDGANITRRWPVERDASQDSHDHPHHRGLWFTHGSVNGVDFWSEDKKAGKTINVGFDNIQSGLVCGGFRARTEWRMPDDKLIATDTRDVSIYPLPNGDRLLDFVITITPVGGEMTFGDTKEGMFGLRLANSLAPNPTFPVHRQGAHIVNSDGVKDTAVWSKKADWVDFFGPLNGQTYGVAMFDNPANFRHPETWHARDYGLFAINPFGLHDFGLGPKGIGDYVLPQLQTLTFHYRLLFHKGDTTTADVANQYTAYADPPVTQVR